jgi:hypothetical protein
VTEQNNEILLSNKNKPLYVEGGEVTPIVIVITKDTYRSKIENYLTNPAFKTLLQNKQIVTIGGQTGYHIEGLTPPVYQYSTLVFYKGNAYDFSNNFFGQNSGITPVFNQILSTVKFAETVDAMAGWKTYTNTTYGFDMKYPSYLEQQTTRNGVLFAAGNGADSFSISLSGFKFENPPAGVVCEYDLENKTWQPDANTNLKDCPQQYIGNTNIIVYKAGTADMFQVYQFALILNSQQSKFVELSVGQNYFDSCKELNECPDIVPLTNPDTIDLVLSTFKFTK